jgi:cation transport protein ChaC
VNLTAADPGLWVFAYGSLLWDPGFVPAEAARARLEGWRRSFCMWSVRWRGTESEPGLVLALDAEEGASCEALALRIEAGQEARILADLRSRELVSDAYEEKLRPVGLFDGREGPALAYVIRRGHAQYAGRLDPEAQARAILRAKGLKGSNLEYLANTAARLDGLGLPDPEIGGLLARVRALAALA